MGLAVAGDGTMGSNLEGELDPAEEKLWAVAVHALYLASLVSGISAVVGLVIAYLRRADASDWARGHYEYAIRTFWIGLVAVVIAIPLCFLVIGFVLLPLIWVWFLLRSLLPLVKASRAEPLANPETWWL
jgi:uncharacterized membrane protein